MTKTVNVIGLGYIGLPTALMLAKHGIKVVGTDIKDEIIDKLTHGELTFEEKGLDDLFSDAVANGITFSTTYQKTDTYIIGVPTPYVDTNKKIDPSFVVSAVESVLQVCEDQAIVVIESTISPGTIDKYIRPLINDQSKSRGKTIHLVHAPERIIPGNMIHELENNSRTIGADDQSVAETVRSLYESFCKSEIVLTDIRSAEMSKIVENTFRDVNIAFANELAKICRTDNMDVYEIIRIANKHPRVNILQPGPGVGGHCISVDPWFLVGDYPDLTNLILTARKINDSMPGHVLKRIREIMTEHNIKDLSRVGLYGLAYKEDVDDTRESPTLQLIETMNEHLAFGIKSYDPHISDTIVDNQFFNFEEFIEGIDLIVVMTAHQHIKSLEKKLAEKIVLDTKNAFIETKTYKL